MAAAARIVFNSSKRALPRVLGTQSPQRTTACACSHPLSASLNTGFAQPTHQIAGTRWMSSSVPDGPNVASVPDVPDTSSVPDVPDNGSVKLNFFKLDGGDATPLVFVHGLYGWCGNFRSLAKGIGKTLRQDREIYSLDLRNHGSSEHSESMDMRAIASDIIRFMDENELETIALVGHSLGGRAAMATALLHPTRIDRLMVVDMSPVSKELTGPDDVGRAMANVPLDQIQNRKEVDTILGQVGLDPSIRQFAMQNLIFEEGKQPHWRLNLPVLNREMGSMGRFDLIKEKDIESYNGYTVFFYGRLSDYVNEEKHGPIIKKFFPQTKFESQASGHWLHAEDPKNFMSTVVRFLRAEVK